MITRRKFIKSSVGLIAIAGCGSAGCSKDDEKTGNGDSNGNNSGNIETPVAKVGAVLPDWQEGYLDIHAINTGRGESTLYIFPDGTTMLVDAAGSLLSQTDATPPTPHKPSSAITSGQVIVNYAKHFIQPASNKLNYMMVTHWHPDHMGNYSTSMPLDPTGAFRVNGITEVGLKIRFDKMLDRDYPAYNYPTNFADTSLVSNYIKFLEWAKTSYGATVEQFNVGSAAQIVLKQNPSKYSNFVVRNIMGNGWVWTGSGTDKANTLPDNVASLVDTTSYENIFSTAFHLKYGSFDYFAGGDLQYNGKSTHAWLDSEAPVINVMGAVDVMKANHHCTSNTNGEAFVNKLRPDTVIAHPWRDVQPNIDTVGRFFSANSNCRFFATGMTDANRERLSAYATKFLSDQGHVVVRVEPQGMKYSVYVLDDGNEDYKVKKICGPYTCS